MLRALFEDKIFALRAIQKEAIEKGEKIVQETRLWDGEKTLLMRSKEEATRSLTTLRQFLPTTPLEESVA